MCFTGKPINQLIEEAGQDEVFKYLYSLSDKRVTAAHRLVVLLDLARRGVSHTLNEQNVDM